MSDRTKGLTYIRISIRIRMRQVFQMLHRSPCVVPGLIAVISWVNHVSWQLDRHSEIKPMRSLGQTSQTTRWCVRFKIGFPHRMADAWRSRIGTLNSLWHASLNDAFFSFWWQSSCFPYTSEREILFGPFGEEWANVVLWLMARDQDRIFVILTNVGYHLFDICW